MTLHCPTCGCSQSWGIVSHHFVKSLEIAVGILLAAIAISWMGIRL